MSTKAHPTEDILLDYASGAMPLAPALTVSAHLDACPICRSSIRLFETIGQSLMADLPGEPLSDYALETATERLNSVKHETVPFEQGLAISGVTLPPAVSAVGVFARRWLAPGLWVARTKAANVDGWRTFIVCLPAGGRIPTHCHRGGELVCVLQGSFNDGAQWRNAGDFSQADDETEHEILVSADGPCVCMISTQAPIKWKGWARLLNPILGL